MQIDDKKKKNPTSAEIVDIPPPTLYETEEEHVSISEGTTQLSK